MILIDTMIVFIVENQSKTASGANLNIGRQWRAQNLMKNVK